MFDVQPGSPGTQAQVAPGVPGGAFRSPSSQSSPLPAWMTESPQKTAGAGEEGAADERTDETPELAREESGIAVRDEPAEDVPPSQRTHGMSSGRTQD